MSMHARVNRYCRTILGAWAPAAVLLGCTVGPDFAPPKPEVPSGWSQPLTGKTRSSVDTKPLATSDWWSNFHDPVLSSLIARAAVANLDLREAALRIAEARAQSEIAAADRWPSVSGNASYARTRFSTTTAQGSLFGAFGGLGKGGGLSVPTFPNPYDQYQLGFDASWEPDLFGKVRRSTEAARADTEASLEDRNDALVSLEAEVARTYIDLRATQLRQAITKDNRGVQHETLLLARQRRRAGLGTDLDVTSAAAQVTATDAQLPPLERRATQDMNALSQLLAREPGALRAELETARPIPPVPPDVPIGLPTDLLRRRPDIRAAEARLHAATARVGVAVAGFFPQLTFNAQLGTQAESFPDLVQWASRFFSVGPTLEIPIFEGGRIKASVALQDVREKEAAVNYAKTVLGAFHEVENALAAYATETQRHSALAATIAQNRRALDLARERYRSGVTTYLEVLDAERTLEQTQLSQADSAAAVSTDLVALYKALGGGWQRG